MTLKDIAKECGCRYAAPYQIKKSTTGHIICRLHNCTTDITHCKKCKESEK